MSKPLLILVDGNSLLHRAYHALPSLTTSAGLPTNAVYGLAQMLLSLLQQHPPAAAAVAFDAPGPTVRHEEYAEYKATRQEAPEDLAPQFDLARQLVEALGLPRVELPGLEADDLIASLAEESAEQGWRVLIVTGDRDLVQLVSDRVQVLATLRGVGDTRLYDLQQVREEYGLAPDQLADYKGLAGDSSDNIPGVPGIGKQTATRLLAQYGSLESLLEHADQVTPPRMARLLTEHRDQALLSKRLAQLRGREAPVHFSEQQYAWRGLDLDRLRTMLVRLEFSKLLERLEGLAAQTTHAAQEQAPMEAADLGEVLSLARDAGRLDLAGAWQQDTLLGLAVGSGPVAWVPLATVEPGNLFPVSAESQPPSELREALTDPDLGKRAPELKRLARALHAHGLTLEAYRFDPYLADYLLAMHRRERGMELLMAEYLDRSLPAADPPAQRAAAEARALPELERAQRARLADLGIEPLLDRLDLPLARVLSGMEQAGIAVDLGGLRRLEERFRVELDRLAGRMHELAGEQFNPDSPQQVGQVLFERVGLAGGKRTKTGWNTSAPVLEVLAAEHELPRLLLEYREYAKLRSTYVRGLLAQADPRTGRVHTTFEQTVTATGRLSSRNPNLQNIPIRTELGREIRACFRAADADWRLLSADYSQIELRLVAHFSGVPHLCEAFAAGHDVHQATAALIFDVAPEAVSSEQRRIAKTVNYAVIYGMGPAALAPQIGVSRDQAAEFIEAYFDRLAGVKQYLEQVVAAAEQEGYVQTLCGRRRYLPDLRSSNPGLRAYAQRAAANTPLQGSAAEIIKLAMLELARRLPQVSDESRLLLQVHDELLLEVPAGQIAQVGAVVQEIMQAAWKLTVPLTVDLKSGANWRDMTGVQVEA